MKLFFKLLFTNNNYKKGGGGGERERRTTVDLSFFFFFSWLIYDIEYITDFTSIRSIDTVLILRGRKY